MKKIVLMIALSAGLLTGAAFAKADNRVIITMPKFTALKVNGAGDAVVFASSSVNVRTSGSSDVDVYGNPKSIQNLSSGSSDFTVHEGK